MVLAFLFLVVKGLKVYIVVYFIVYQAGLYLPEGSGGGSTPLSKCQLPPSSKSQNDLGVDYNPLLTPVRLPCTTLSLGILNEELIGVSY